MTALSYASGSAATPLRGETIVQNLRGTVDRFGDREALVVPHQSYRATYRQLWDEVSLVARGLMARGVEKGDRVGIWAPNRYEWVVVQYATAAIGAILVNINPAYRAGELEYALKQSGTSVLILARGFRQADYVAMVREVRSRCPELRQTLVLEQDWDQLREQASRVSDASLAEREALMQFDDPINIQYTSGTTGFPKGATLSHHNLVNNAFFIGEILNYGPQDRVCLPVPFYHCFGMVLGNLACTTHGACIVVPGEAFDALSVMRTVEAERCTSLYGVPTMFIGELDHPEFSRFDFRTLRTGIMAGSPCPVEVMKRVIADMHMPEVTICYGMTETSPVSTQSKTNDPLETRVAIDSARWMHTGDLATMDEASAIKIVGRIKDMVIRGGENIYPREIEEFLYTHPAISDVQVIGVPDAKYGEEIMAWVKLRSDAQVSDAELRAYCQGKIATYKIPRYWKFVDGFPMTVTGKVQKYKMREQAIEELKLEKAAAVQTA